MDNKSHELELLNIMQGLEEFATFMSYQSDYSNLKIISVETVSEYEEKLKAKVIPFNKPKKEPLTDLNERIKTLKFFDKVMH